MKHFADKLVEAIKKKNSIVCVGLDPQLDRVPEFLKKKFSPAEAIFEFNKGIIDAVHDIAPVVKLQIAFYELLGHKGVEAFEKTLRYAESKKLLTIADAKRNDVGHTAEAYAETFLGPDVFNADSVTVTPYLGWDSVKPFTEVATKQGKGVFVLVKTSNQSSVDVQDLEMKDGNKVFEIMGHYVESWGSQDIGDSGYSFIGAVVGATFPDQARKLRKIMPENFFLVPGYGAQGGSVEGVKACLNEDGHGAIINNSRGVIFAYEKSEKFGPKNYTDAARIAVEEMNSEINAIRS